MPAAPRVLSGRALNRALLARQRLLARSRSPLPRVLEQVGGLQAQYAPSAYVGLWSRVEGFERAALTRALRRRTVAQGTLMRGTIHLVSARDYWPLAIAVRAPRRDLYLRGTSTADGAPYEQAAVAVRAALAERGTLRRAELDELAGRDRREGIGLWVDLVRVPPSGTWERRRADLYADAEAWLGPPSVVDVDAAREQLVRRYLGAFGPATALDVAGWSGLSPASVAAVVARLRLRRFRAEDGAVLLDLPRAPLPDPGVEAPVRFLPTWDATLLAHARRAGVLPADYRSQVFATSMPQSVPTFLVDGVVAGTWRYESGRVTTEEFAPLPARARRRLEDEAGRLARWYG